MYTSEGNRLLAKTDESVRDFVEVGDDAPPDGAERRVRGQMVAASGGPSAGPPVRSAKRLGVLPIEAVRRDPIA